MKRKLTLMLALLFVWTGVAWSQGVTVKGVVTSEEDGLPIVGASVLVKGTTQGTITDVDEWGKKRLAYEIQKMKEGFYYFIHFEGDSNCPNEVEAHVRIMEPVIRYLCVRQDAK